MTLDCGFPAGYVAPPVAPDIVYHDPLTPPGHGIDAWRDFVSPILPAFKGVRVQQHVSEGDRVATLWEADTIWGVIEVFELFHVVDGRIKEARAFFDPRPIIIAQPDTFPGDE